MRTLLVLLTTACLGCTPAWLPTKREIDLQRKLDEADARLVEQQGYVGATQDLNSEIQADAIESISRLMDQIMEEREARTRDSCEGI